MKKLSNSLFFIFFSVLSFAQLHDKIWLTGNFSTWQGGNWGYSKIDFDNSLPTVTQDSFHLLSLSTCGTTISDGQGNRQFYCNGRIIANDLEEIMQNGDSLGFTFEPPYFHYSGASHDNQGLVALPAPSADSIYYLLYLVHKDSGNYAGTHLLYSKIDMAQNSGLGAVVEKNVIVVENALMPTGLTAVRHANGRDWWLLVFQYETKKYYRVLVSDQGISVEGISQVDVPVVKDLYGQFVFSPDGSKFVATPTGWDVQKRHWVEIFDFDRCTGLLSNRKRVYCSQRYVEGGNWVSDHAQGAAISPNSRYLYLFYYRKVYQVDLQAPDLQASLTRIADHNGFKDDWTPNPQFGFSYFGLAQLAPDGKIYTAMTHPNDALHVTEKPNSPGLFSKVVQRGLELPSINNNHIPNHPNYRLQPLEGSPCDTLGIQKAVFIQANPYPAEGCLGGEAYFEVTAFGTGMTYQWQRSSDGGTTWLDVQQDVHFTGVNTEILHVGNLSNDFNNWQFRCIVTGNVSTEISRSTTLTIIGQAPAAAFSFVQDQDSLHFTNLTGGADYIQWYFGDGDSILVDNPSRLYRHAGIYPAMIIATNACGKDTFVQDIIIPELEANFTANITSGCAPLEVTYSSQTPFRVVHHKYLTPGGTPPLAWALNGETIVVYNSPGIYDATHIAYTQLNLENDTLIKQDYITVLDGVKPVAEIQASQSGDTVHLSSSFALADSLTWHFSTGDTLAGQNVSYVFGAPGIYQVILQVANQCGTALDTMEFVVGELAASFASNQQSGCVPLTVQFENTTVFPLDSVQWHFPGGSPAFSNQLNPSVLYETPGSYDAMLVAFAGNLADTLALAAHVEALPDDCPQAEIFTQINDLLVTAWTNCEEGISYSWNMGDGVTFNTEGVAYQYDSAGTYNLQLIVNGTCGSDTAWTTVTVEDPLETKDVMGSLPFTFIIQPNPASHWLEISTSQPIAQPVAIRFRNALGEISLAIEKENWQGKERLSLNRLPAGVYFYEIEVTGAGIQIGKLIVAD